MKNMKRLGLFIALIAAAFVVAPHAQTLAQSAGLTIGGSSANFGSHAVRGGFMPDPKQVRVVSGGSLDASTMNLGPGCQGFVTRQPDAIVNLTNPGSFLRLFYKANGSGDTTLIINDANGRWHCNDDSHGGLNPTVDLTNPGAGQYDIWVGSYEAGANISGQLNITELRNQHP